jgi:hypothetical protein
LINNRQNGRRRGRGGGPRSPNSTPSQGNRQDNRQRGNAAQLLEKYKALARDSQLAGDRVQTEYYLQFAEHYFRVLNENRSRFEEQRPRRDDFMSDEDEDDEAMMAEGADGDDGQGEPDRHEPRDQRGDEGQERQERQDRQERPERAASRDQYNGGEPRRERPRRDRPRRDRVEEVQDAAGEERISLEVLPPAIAPDGDGAAKPPRVRRPRRPRPDGDAEIAPAA